MRFTRRGVLWGLGGTIVAATGVRFALPFAARPGEVVPVDAMSPPARELVEASFDDVNRSKLWDVHTHVVGLGKGGTGCFANDEMQSHFKPIQRLQFDMYLAASGIKHRNKTDQEFIERLGRLARAANPQGRNLLMAFDQHVREDGSEDRSRSPFYVPNDYVAELARKHAQFGMIASVHPYRKDALKRLRKARRQGAVAVKWLPNAMGIDPQSPRCDPFYEVMREQKLVLISHTGVEQAVHAEEAQRLGNPLRLRRPLDAGVRVVAAHCATLGNAEDLDAAGHPQVAAIDLFLRMMGEAKYDGRLFGDLSAITLQNREPEVLVKLLQRTELHQRLVNGSDYPVIAVDPVISLNRLSLQGLLEEEDIEPLREIFVGNSLLFDYVLKRRLVAKGSGGGTRFSPQAFETSHLFRAAAL